MSKQVEIIFATGNQNKVDELLKLLPNSIQIKSLKDIGFTDELPETQATIKANAKQKADAIFHTLHEYVFAEDTGLEVEALNGEPGVKSARYAGPNKNAEDNMNLLLEKLEGIENRTAQFKTVIALHYNNELHFFEGILKGKILLERKGSCGFGYDPIFQPEGFQKSLAEMTIEEKNQISHRAKATKQFVKFLTSA